MPVKTRQAASVSHDEQLRLARECARAVHHRMCDADLCHPDCPYRAAAKAADRHFPGGKC